MAPEARLITVTGIWMNISLCACKAAVGTIAGSAALIADAAHSLSDLISDGVALLALKLTSAPPDKLHPYGYGHYETLGTLTVAAILAVLSAELAIGAVLSLFELNSSLSGSLSQTLEASITNRLTAIALGTALVSVVTKEWLFRRTLRIGQQARSSVVIANAWHHRGDALSSAVAVVGIGGKIISTHFRLI
jgi:cation diffusion facilitator family transporter